MTRSRLFVGLMSGTSLDGIDAVLLSVRGNGPATVFRQLAYVERPFPARLRAMLIRNSFPESSRVDEIARLNVLLGELYVEAVRHLVRKARVKLSSLHAIGSHGQTIHHLPQPYRMLGRTIRATLQIGDPSVIAVLTGVTTVGDFRVADMAVGGQGAPLVPYVDWILFRSSRRNRLLLNIGGIANLTVLPRGCEATQVIAFDTGPGNMVVDSLMRELYGRPCDTGGATAARGTVPRELFRRMARHPYLRTRPPKSTGREEFGKKFVQPFLAHARGYRRQDVITAASEFTAYAVFDAYRRFVQRRMVADELIVSGGGARNRFFLERLQRYFTPARVCTVDEFGVSSDAKEAVCFALLANETLAARPANLPSVTGARRRVVLGKICSP